MYSCVHVNFKVVFLGNDAYWCVWNSRPCLFGGGRGVNGGGRGAGVCSHVYTSVLTSMGPRPARGQARSESNPRRAHLDGRITQSHTHMNPAHTTTHCDRVLLLHAVTHTAHTHTGTHKRAQTHPHTLTSCVHAQHAHTHTCIPTHACTLICTHTTHRDPFTHHAHTCTHTHRAGESLNRTRINRTQHTHHHTL